MPRKYRHIQDQEKEIIELIRQGNTLREIGNKLGFTYEQMRYVIASKNRYIKKLEMEIKLMQDFLLLTERK